MSFIPMPPDDEPQDQMLPHDVAREPDSLDRAKDPLDSLDVESDDAAPLDDAFDGPPTSEPLPQSAKFELPFDPEIAEALAAARQAGLDPLLPSGISSVAAGDAMDVSMVVGPESRDGLADRTDRSWSDQLDRILGEHGPRGASSPPNVITTLPHDRNEPAQIEQLPHQPGVAAPAPQKLSQLPVSESAKEGHADLDFRATSSSDPLSRAAASPAGGASEYKPLGYARPTALVQLADYEQFFLDEQNALTNRLIDLARQIAKEEIDHAAWVDYIHDRAIFGPH